MKYIRTKDGNIYEYANVILSQLIGTDILEEADTIEELCDEFVGISDGEPQMLRFVPYACAQYWDGGVYGAVWCEFGLKYVARMNNEGKLELL